MIPPEGEQIYIESLLSVEEYRQMSRKYPNAYRSPIQPGYFHSEFDWRYKMGQSLIPDEIRVINMRLDAIKRAGGL